MEERAVRLQKVSFTSATVQLAPQATARMAIRAKVPQPPARGQKCLEVSIARGRRWVGDIGSGPLGGGTGGWVVSCSQAAQWGLCVRPSKGLGSLERLRLNMMGTGSASFGGDGGYRLGQA